MPSLDPARREDPIDLASFVPTTTQGGMVVNTLRDPARGVELEQVIVRFAGEVARDRLAQAFQEAQARHAALRSAFRWDAGTLTQEVHASAPMPFASLELPDEEALESFLAADRKRGFDPSVPPLTRAVVARARGGDDVLVWTFHHAILDGRSYRLVLEEVLDRYDGRELDPRSPPSFAEFCRWLASKDFTPSRVYFAKLLEGASATPLPLARTDRGGSRHAESELRVGDIAEPLRGAERLGISIANVIQAAWAWTLARRARTDDVLFATTRSGRLPGFPDADRVVGCLIDTLPMRISVDEHASAQTLLAHVRAQGLALRDHDHAPLTEIVASADVALSSLVVVERYDLDTTMRARGGPNAERRFSLREQSDFPLVLAAYQDGSGMRLVLEHDSATLPAADARLLLEHVARSFAALGAAALSGDERALATMDVLAPGERERLERWARGPLADARPPRSVTERFAEVARARRDEVAVRDAHGAQLSYRELSERARRLGAALTSMGAREGEIVLVLLPRSIHWVVSMWAIWHAEATYVPLDPAWPRARLGDVLDDLLESGATRTPVVVVNRATRELARLALPRAARLEVDDAWDHPLPPSTSETAVLEPSSGASPLAYLLYTSGTTGRPKGSRILHRSLAAHAEAAISTFGLAPTDRVLQFTSLGFDVSIEEVVPTLLAGGRVLLRSEEAAHDLEGFLTEVARAGASVLNLPSAFLHELMLHLERARRELPRSVRLIIVGGERPSPESFARFVTVTRGAAGGGTRPRFVNGYGPTEVTITSVACDTLATGVPPDGRTELPIGRAFGACRAYVVRVPDAPTRMRRRGDKISGAPPPALAPVLAATGEPGELWLAGPQVADGYLARPEVTERVFVEDPFARPEDRDRTAYRTGDLVRRDLRGDLVFLGRIDRQLKLRGHRIEPGEIESALLTHEAVREAVVVLAGEAESRALVAFVTTADVEVDVVSLRDALTRTLPAVMVPSRVLVLAELPLAPTGKIDRDELVVRASAALRDAIVGHENVEPRDDLEAWLRPLFAEVLGKDDVDLERSFFELGGHSLLAIRLLTRLKDERPDLSMTLAMLFAHPSVRALAEALREAHPEEAPTLVRLNPKRADIEGAAPLFCVCGVQLYGPLARAMEGDRPVYGVFLPVEAEAVAEGGSLDVVSLARGYVELVRQRSPHGPYLLAGVSFGGLLAFEMAQQLLARGEEVRLLALFDTILPRALEETPWTARARGQLRKLRRGSDELLSALRRRAVKLSSSLAGALGPKEATGETDARRDEEVRDDVLRAAGEAYDQIVRPYPGRVVIFRARGGLGYEGEVVRWDMGWSGLVRPDTPVHGVPGDHLGILREPGVSEIAATLRSLLSR